MASLTPNLEAAEEKAVQEQVDLLTAFARVVTTWNFLENTVRSLVTRLISSPEERLLRELGRSHLVKGAIRRAEVVTTHLGNVTMTDVLRVLAKVQMPALESHLTHLAKLFDRLREHRNFYVHGITGPGSHIDEKGNIETTAMATQVSAKGGLTVSSIRFSKRDLELFAEQMNSAATYQESIIFALLNPDFPIEEMSSVVWTPLASLQKPPIPNRMLRSREFLIGEPPPPQS